MMSCYYGTRVRINIFNIINNNNDDLTFKNPVMRARYNRIIYIIKKLHIFLLIIWYYNIGTFCGRRFADQRGVGDRRRAHGVPRNAAIRGPDRRRHHRFSAVFACTVHTRDRPRPSHPFSRAFP